MINMLYHIRLHCVIVQDTPLARAEPSFSPHRGGGGGFSPHRGGPSYIIGKGI